MYHLEGYFIHVPAHFSRSRLSALQDSYSRKTIFRHRHLSGALQQYIITITVINPTSVGLPSVTRARARNGNFFVLVLS